MRRKRILFAGNFHWNAGSSHVISAYVAASGNLDYEIGVSTQLSRLDEQIPRHLPLVDDLGWATHLIFVFEGRQFLSDAQLDLCQSIPRHRRIVIDADGHWGPTVTMGADSSQGSSTAESWHWLYAALTDVVLQPKISGPLPQGAAFFSYFGMPRIHRRPTDGPCPGESPYELQYIGSNWWRWDTLSSLVRAAASADPPVSRMRVCGRWWDGDACPGHEQATVSEAGWLRNQGVEVAPSVPFGHVVSEMSLSAITPILARPVLATMGMLTPRMFETLVSGSVPVLTDNLAYVASVYGDDIQLFLLGDNPSDTLARVLHGHDHYRQRLELVQAHVQSTFNYERVLAALSTYLQ